MNIFAVPNSRKCGYHTSNYLRKEGVTSGVADVILLIPSGDLHGLCIEFKVGKNTQTDTQKDFEMAVLVQDYAYYVIKDFDTFITKIKNYLE
jgi:hypothetical protein